MTAFFYEPQHRFSFGDTPFFPDREDVPIFNLDSDPLTVDEGKTYYVKFYPDSIPFLFESAPFQPKQLHSDVWEFNFRNYVGRSKIGDLFLNIRNKKITDDLYNTMLDYITDKFSGLVFSFGTPAGQYYSKEGAGSDPLFIQYLFIKKYLLDDSPDIDGITGIISRDPHWKIETWIRDCDVSECAGMEPWMADMLLTRTMAAIRRGHPLQETALAHIIKEKTGKSLFPSSTVREIRHQTVDTNENRFVKFFLYDILQKITAIADEIGSEKSSYFNPEIHEYIRILKEKINHFLSHEMWKDVGTMTFFPANSQVLQRKEGYSSLFSLFSLLQLSSHCDFLQIDFNHLIEIKDAPTLYEYWCFFQVKTVLDGFLKPKETEQIFTKTTVEHILSKGLVIHYENGVDLYFNQEYSGSNGIHNLENHTGTYTFKGSYSHTMRPDIVLEKNGNRLVFDAKYKGKRSGFYGEDDDGEVKSWKPEDINKMHTYREAISNVVGSFILYPGSRTVVYKKQDRSNIYEGVGAISLRPDIKSSVNQEDFEKLTFLISTYLEHE